MKQEEIVLSTLAGNDTLALLPTGGGKSICFQVPVMCREGLGLVISPLVALMQDQVSALNRKGIRAHAITSFMSWREMDVVLDNCVYGNVKFLYVSPERLHNELFRTRLARMKINLIAVDEAHCISQWGYDFRPAYLQIAEIRKLKPGIPVLALTASATPPVVLDIQDKLLFPKKNLISSSFVRHNLIYVVYKVEDKDSKLLDVCKNVQGQGVVYCGTRHKTKETAEFLKRHKISATFYHAGLSQGERQRAQESWFKGKDRVICATNAFGMGIDKPNVRFVVHMDVPADPEAYFQEAGRAGRDGNRAYALLMYNQADLDGLVTKTIQQFPSQETIRATYRAICNHLQIAMGAGDGQIYNLDLAEVCKKFTLKYQEAFFSIKILERAGFISVNESWSEPSRLFFTVNRNVLYNYQVANSNMDVFIKLLLRMYGGLFEQYTVIREDDIARSGKMTGKEVREKLVTLSTHAIADYKPRSEEPRISFVQPRVRDEHLRLPKEVYELRKTSAEQRARSMIHYMETPTCRSVQLLQYFGEKDPEACGKCDVCTHKKQSGLKLEDFETLSQMVIEILLRESMTVEQILNRFPSSQRESLIQLVQWKLDEGDWKLQADLKIEISDL